MTSNPKNLSYDAKQPAFLQRLRNEHSHQASDSDRHTGQLTRPRGRNLPNEDDEPTYVDENSNIALSKAEFEALVAIHTQDERSAKTTAEQTGKAKPTTEMNDSTAKDADIVKKNNFRKRKAAKLIGYEENDSAVGILSKKNKSKRSKVVKLSFTEDGEAV